MFGATPLLASTINSLQSFFSFRLFLVQSPVFVRYSICGFTTTHFSNYLSLLVLSFLFSIVNAAFNDLITTHYSHFCLVFTDGSVSRTFAGYCFYISNLSIKFSNNILLFTSSFTTKFLTILEALLTIIILFTHKFLICFDSQVYLVPLNSLLFWWLLFSSYNMFYPFVFIQFWFYYQFLMLFILMSFVMKCGSFHKFCSFFIPLLFIIILYSSWPMP